MNKIKNEQEWNNSHVLKNLTRKVKNFLWTMSMKMYDKVIGVHCVKIVRIRSYSGPYFSAFGLNTGQNNYKYGQFFQLSKT